MHGGGSFPVRRSKASGQCSLRHCRKAAAQRTKETPRAARRKSNTVRAQASPNTGNWPYFAARAARAPKRSDTTKQNDENRTAHLQLIVASEPPRACSRSNVLAIPPALRGCEKSRGPRVLQTGSGSPATRIALEKSAAAFRLRPAAARSARV